METPFRQHHIQNPNPSLSWLVTGANVQAVCTSIFASSPHTLHTRRVTYLLLASARCQASLAGFPNVPRALSKAPTAVDSAREHCFDTVVVVETRGQEDGDGIALIFAVGGRR